MTEEKKQNIPVPPGMNRMRLAHAYVPYQYYSQSYPPEKALERGTLFPELYMPYKARR